MLPRRDQRQPASARTCRVELRNVAGVHTVVARVCGPGCISVATACRRPRGKTRRTARRHKFIEGRSGAPRYRFAGRGVGDVGAGTCRDAGCRWRCRSAAAGVSTIVRRHPGDDHASSRSAAGASRARRALQAAGAQAAARSPARQRDIDLAVYRDAPVFKMPGTRFGRRALGDGADRWPHMGVPNIRALK